MFRKLAKDITLKEILELHENIERKQNFGFDICCAKMDALKDVCRKKNLNPDHVLEELNKIAEELNEIERITEEMKSNLF